MLSLAALALLGIVFYQSRDYLTDGVISESIRYAPAFLLVFPLTAANLFCEVKKWQSLLGVRGASLARGFEQVLSGICSGFVTPNRIGEFAGRLAFLPEHLKSKGPAATFTGSFIQGSATALFGILGLLFFPFFPKGFTEVNGLALLVMILALASAAAIYFRMSDQNKFKRVRAALRYFHTLERTDFIRATWWALLRYLCFSTQFVLSLYCFGFSGTIIEAYTGVFLLYFCQSFIPGAALGELGIREVLAMVIFGAFLNHPLSAVFAGLTVWLANIGIPVLVGVSITGFSLRHGHR